jgi:branched-chain amino acid aminotransferase
MITEQDFKITLTKNSRLKDIDLKDLPFGKYFTDHMLVVEYHDGIWGNVEIMPYQSLLLSPSVSSLHYGQAIFEGIKAYKDPNGELQIFRPYDNFARFNISAERMMMPVVPEEIFIGGMRKLLSIDKAWAPDIADHALYIRPYMFSCDETLGVRVSEHYRFIILLSPTGPYYSAPMRISVEEKYVRAVPGGVGFIKCAGNYGAALLATVEAQKKGYDQVLWTDAFEHKYVQECGTMNVFFIIGNKAITPDLDAGTILAGVTRDSALVLLKEMGFEIEERALSIDEIIEAYKSGTLKEIFGTGTAAVISMIKELKYKDFVMKFDVDTWKTAPELKRRIDAIRAGLEPDTYGWLMKV